MNAQAPVDLSGLVDLHMHTAPDVRPRLLDDLEAAAQAAEAGMRAIVLKSHVTGTADRAIIAEKVVSGVRVIGSLTLNYDVGGLNPAAVEVALKMGARVIWMPTLSARGLDGRRGSLNVWEDGEEGKLSAAAREVIRLVAAADVALGTGHLTVPEIVAVVKGALEAGVRKVMVTHPEHALVDLPLSTQEELGRMGAYFERCWNAVAPPTPSMSLEKMVHHTRVVGIEHSVLSTDFGQMNHPTPVQGMRDFVSGLLAQGFKESEIRLMGAEQPAALLGL